MSIQVKTFKPQDAKVKALVYGASGIGKTTFGASAPKPLFLSAEGGLLSVAEKNVQYVQIGSSMDLENTLRELQNMCKGQGSLLKDGKPLFETVVIDSLTEIQHVIMDNITGGKRDPQLKDWGTFSNKMRGILRAYRDLPLHVVFVALEDEKDDEDQGITRYKPAMYGKLGAEVQGFMDLVGRMAISRTKKDDKEQEKRGICFASNPRFVAKDRTGKLPAFVEPNFTTILQAIGTIETGEEETLQTDNTQGFKPASEYMGESDDKAKQDAEAAASEMSASEGADEAAAAEAKQY